MSVPTPSGSYYAVPTPDDDYARPLREMTRKYMMTVYHALRRIMALYDSHSASAPVAVQVTGFELRAGADPFTSTGRVFLPSTVIPLAHSMKDYHQNLGGDFPDGPVDEIISWTASGWTASGVSDPYSPEEVGTLYPICVFLEQLKNKTTGFRGSVCAYDDLCVRVNVFDVICI